MGISRWFCAASCEKTAAIAPSTSTSEQPAVLPETAALSHIPLRVGPAEACLAGVDASSSDGRQQPYTPPIRPPPQHSQSLSDMSHRHALPQLHQEEAGSRQRPASRDLRAVASGDLNLRGERSLLQPLFFQDSPSHALSPFSGRDSFSNRGLPAGPPLASPVSPRYLSSEHFFLHETPSARGSTGGPLSVDIISRALRTGNGRPGADSPGGGGCSGVLSPRGTGGTSSQAETLMRDLNTMRMLGRGGCGTVYLVGKMRLPA